MGYSMDEDEEREHEHVSKGVVRKGKGDRLGMKNLPRALLDLQSTYEMVLPAYVEIQTFTSAASLYKKV